MSEQNRDKDLSAQPKPERTVKEILRQQQSRKPTEVISLDVAEEGEAPLGLDVEIFYNRPCMKTNGLSTFAFLFLVLAWLDLYVW